MKFDRAIVMGPVATSDSPDSSLTAPTMNSDGDKMLWRDNVSYRDGNVKTCAEGGGILAKGLYAGLELKL